MSEIEVESSFRDERPRVAPTSPSPSWLLNDFTADTWRLKEFAPGNHRARMTVSWMSFHLAEGIADRVRWARWKNYARRLAFHIMESDKTGVSKTSSLATLAREIRAACEFFCFQIGAENISQVGRVELDAFEDHIKGLGLSVSAAEMKLSVLWYAWILKEDVGEGLTAKPFLRGKRRAIAKRLASPGGHTPTIMPREFFELMNAALERVLNASDVLDRLSVYLACKKDGDPRRVARRYQSRQGESSAKLFDDVRCLYAAALIVVFALTAQRKHEQSAIGYSGAKQTADGSCDLKGVEHKTAGTISGKETSRAVIAEVRVALSVIIGLTAETRALSGLETLLLRLPIQHSVARGEPEFELTSAGLYSLMDTFTRRYAGGQKIRPHMFRRAFAMLWAWRFETGDLYYLSKLLYHNSYQFTVTYTEDEDVWEFLPEEMREFTNQLLEDAFLGSRNLVGGVATSLRRYARLLQARVSVLNPGAVGDFVEALTERLGLIVYPFADGYCFITKARRKRARCSTDGVAPNHARRNADLCNACSNFGVDESRREIWQLRERFHREVHESTDIPFLREASLEGAAVCQKKLRQLDEVGPWS